MVAPRAMDQVETTTVGEPVSALSPLRIPVFRAIWIANTVSSVGSLIQSVGASWLMTSITSSADMVALVQSSVALPLMLLSLVAGALADNMDRRKLMLASQTFMMLTSIALTVCAWLGLMTPWLLLFFTFLIGCGGAFNAPAWQASVRDMVPREQLPGAVALTSVGYNIARSLGPAIGGALVAATGPAAAFTVNAITYTGLIAVLLRWRSPHVPQSLPRETLGTAMVVGIRYVAMSPVVRTVLLRGFLFGLGSSSVMALMPLVAKHLVGGGPITFGVLLGAFGVGAIAGAMGSAYLRSRLTSEGIVRLASMVIAVATLTLGFSTHLWLTTLALVVGGAAWLMAFATFNITVQMSAPRWVSARALSIYQMNTFGGMALGSWLWGVIAQHYGLTPALTASAGVLLGCAVIGRVLSLPNVEQLNLSPQRAPTQPNTAVSVSPHTGPVMATVEYRIREGELATFFSVMSERRRIRRRDGAHDWTLLRDLADPQIWIERYQVATWADYIRHHNRATQEDALVSERLRVLHCDPRPPVSRRMVEQELDAQLAGRIS